MSAPAVNQSHHTNNFDFLRMTAALAVLVSHHYVLCNRGEPLIPLFAGTPAALAVLVFFSISGYLVSKSWFHDPHVGRFCLRRVLRIWPALVVLVCLWAVLLGPLLTQLPLRSYFTQRATWAYFLYLVMWPANDHLPGVFVDNPRFAAVNGSLWTIPIEVGCYVLLAACAAAGLLRNRRGLLGCIALFAAWHIGYGFPGMGADFSFARQFLAYFLMGAAMCALEPLWLPRRAMVLLAAALAFAVLRGLLHWDYLAFLLTLPVAVVVLGSSQTWVLRRAGRWGDFSYGTYIWAFPVQQFVISRTFGHWPFGLSLLAALLGTLAIAALSWHAVEKPALRYKPVRPGGFSAEK